MVQNSRLFKLVYIIEKINAWPYIIGWDFVLGNYSFGSIKLTKISDPDNHKYSDYRFGFDVDESFLLPNGNWFRKNVITFGAERSSLVQIDDKKKDIFILYKGPTNRYYTDCRERIFYKF